LTSIDELLSLLERMGVSKAEAKLYLKVLEDGSINLEGAAKLLGCSVREAETLLKAMTAKGLLKPSVNNSYEALKPKEAVNALLKAKIEELNARLEHFRGDASKLISLLEGFYAERHLGVKPEELLKPLEALSSMELQTVKMLSEAQREVNIFTAGFGWLDKVYEELSSAKSRGVKVKVLMRVVDEESRKAAERLKDLGAEVRVQREPWYPLRGTIVDDSKLVFLIWATEHKTRYYRPHYTENEGLIKVFKEAFSKRWEDAEAYT